MKKHSREWIWRIKILLTVVLCMGIAAWQNIEVYGNSEENQKQQETEEEGDGDTKNLSQDETEITEELLEEVDLSDVQKMLDELLGKDSFSMKEALIKLTRGERAFSKEALQEFVYRSLFYHVEQEKELFVKLLLLILLSAAFAGFAEVFENNQIADISFVVVYL